MKTNRLRSTYAAMGLGASALLGLVACQPTVPEVPSTPTWGPGSTTTLPGNGVGTPTTVATPTTATPTTAAPTTAPPTTPAPTTTAPPATTTPPTTPPTTTPNAPAGWTLVGGDEFNDTTVDPTKWKQYHNTYGDGNKEMACLTPNNLVEGGGSLKIVAKKQTVTCPSGSVRNYTSGFIGSREVGKYYQKYGRFEVRAKVPHAQGLWPAFWLRHRNGASTAEVDVMEYFHALHPGKTSGTLHLDGKKNASQQHRTFESTSGPSGWHTWRTDILPDPNGVRFDFYLDDVKYHTFVDTQHAWASSDDASTWDMALNLAVGGSWTGQPDGVLGYFPDLGRCAIGGTAPNGCTTTGIQRVNWNDPADSTYEIDYVRVYRR